jgi:hypothetical protein
MWATEAPVFRGTEQLPDKKRLYIRHPFYSYNSTSSFPDQMLFRISDSEDFSTSGLYADVLSEAYTKPSTFYYSGGSISSYAYLLASVSSKGDKALVVVQGPSAIYVFGGRPTISVAEIIELQFEIELEVDDAGVYSFRKNEIKVVKVVEADNISSGTRVNTTTQSPPKVYGITSYEKIEESENCLEIYAKSYTVKHIIDADQHVEKQITWDPETETWESVDPLDAFTIVAEGARSASDTYTYAEVLGAFYDDTDTIQQITLTTVDHYSYSWPAVSELSISGVFLYGRREIYRDENCELIEPSHIVERTEDVDLNQKITITGKFAAVSASGHSMSTTLQYGNIKTLSFGFSYSGTGGGSEMERRVELRDDVFEGQTLALPGIYVVRNTTFKGGTVTGNVTVDFPFPESNPLIYTKNDYSPPEMAVSQGYHNYNNTTFWLDDVVTSGAGNGAVYTVTLDSSTRGSVPTLGDPKLLLYPDDTVGTRQLAYDNFFNMTYGDNWIEFFLDYHCGCDAVSIAAFQGDWSYVNFDQEVLRSPILTKKGFIGEVSEDNKFVGGRIPGASYGFSNYAEVTGLYDKNRDCASYNPILNAVVYLSNTPITWCGKWKTPSCWEEVPPSEDVLPEGAKYEIVPVEPEEE